MTTVRWKISKPLYDYGGWSPPTPSSCSKTLTFRRPRNLDAVCPVPNQPSGPDSSELSDAAKLANLVNARRSKYLFEDLLPLDRPAPPPGFASQFLGVWQDEGENQMRESTKSLYDFMRGYTAGAKMDITTELNDLKDIYEQTDKHLVDQEEMNLTCLVYQMKEFIKAHEARKLNQEKLEALKAKLPKQDEDEGGR